MACKDLLVVLDADPRSRERVAVAAALAARFDAHLVGLYLEPYPVLERADFLAPSMVDKLYRDIKATHRQQLDATQALFEDAVRRHSVSAEWRSECGPAATAAALHGRYTDLIILGQLDRDTPEAQLVHPRPAEVTLLAGRPVLVIPYAGSFREVGRRVLVGWDRSREATRAVNDALPFLTGASSVTVMTVDRNPDDEGIPGADIALHLARHGVTAQVENTVSAGIGVGDVLLSRANDIGADLLVMGAYGHSRVRELILGGATRTILDSMTLPVLMAH